MIPTIFRYNIQNQANPYKKRNSNSIHYGFREGGGSEIQRGLQSALRSEGGGSEIQRLLQSALRSEGGDSEILRALRSALGREPHGIYHQCLYQPISCFR